MFGIGFLCVLSMGVSCEKEDFASLSGKDVMSRQDEDVCFYVNQTISIVQEFIEQSQSGGKIVAVDFGIGDNKSLLVFDNGESVAVNLVMPQSRIGYPDITVKLKDGGYYWILRKAGVRRMKELAIRIGGDIPQVKYGRGVWLCRIGTKTWEPIETTDTSNMQIDLFSLSGYASATFSTGCHADVEWERKIFMLRSDVPNESYYKDIFLDAGYALTDRIYLPAAAYLGLSMEYFSSSLVADTVLQNQIIGGDSQDINGRLLYPDGQPRYKMLFVVGGDSKTHAKSLREQTRERMKDYYYGGGSYVGTCAGAAFISSGFDGHDNYPYYLHIWPTPIIYSNLKNTTVNIGLKSDSPLLHYYQFGGDDLVKEVRHNKGNYVDHLPVGAEVLAWNVTSSDNSLYNKPAIWAYKQARNSGRLVVTGSHPEGYTGGERRDLMAAMIRYAIDGRGVSPIKGVLKNGEVREMSRTTEDNDPDYTKIGDLQYHHFVVYIPQGAVNIDFQVSSSADCDMQLLLSRHTIPYSDRAEYSTVGLGASQTLHFSKLEQGLWYVSVRCNTTVTETTEEWGQVYSGRTDVLNGVPYTVSVKWDRMSTR